MWANKLNGMCVYLMNTEREKTLFPNQTVEACRSVGLDRLGDQTLPICHQFITSMDRISRHNQNILERLCLSTTLSSQCSSRRAGGGERGEGCLGVCASMLPPHPE